MVKKDSDGAREWDSDGERWRERGKRLQEKMREIRGVRGSEE